MLEIDGKLPANLPKVNFDSFARTLQKVSYKIFHRKTYFTYLREFLYNVLPKIVIKSIYKCKHLLANTPLFIAS